MIFLVKAGMLTGTVLHSGGRAVCHGHRDGRAPAAIRFPIGITLFGVVSAGCFFFPGLKYYRQQRAAADRDL